MIVGGPIECENSITLVANEMISVGPLPQGPYRIERLTATGDRSPVGDYQLSADQRVSVIVQ